MVATVIASFLLIVPFLALGLFKDKKRGFIYVLFFLLLFHTALAFFTQLFGIFYYQVILAATVLADLAVTGYCLYATKFWQFNFKSINVAKILSKTLLIDWMLLAIVIISVLSLYQVHYNYTGKISLTRDAPNEYHDVKNMKYAYPYFSDEWYAVSLINSSIDSHHLPLNSAFNSNFFINLGIFSHSFLAELMVLFGFNPLLHYTVLSIVINTLVIVLAYTLLRVHAVSKISSAVAVLSMLYITSGVNLPGVWNLLPVTFGVLFCLLIFCFISFNDSKMVFLSFIMASLFYGLLIPFYGLATAVFLLSQLYKNKEAIFKIAGCGAAFLFLVVPVGLILLILSPFGWIVEYLIGKLFYVPLSGSFIPQLNVFYIIPIPIMLLAIIGLPFILRNKRWLSATLMIGCLYWATYFFISYRIIIEFERVVFFTSITISLIAGFGLDRVLWYMSLKFKYLEPMIFRYGGGLVIALFLLLIPFYTNHNNWSKLISIDSANGAQGVPRAPANNYLTEDDMRIFKDIKHKRFLSVPWKGTVMGVATGNYPLVVKAGTIYFGFDSDVDLFLQSDCKSKNQMAQAKNLDYIYLYGFNCPGFQKMDESREGFILYKFIR